MNSISLCARSRLKRLAAHGVRYLITVAILTSPFTLIFRVALAAQDGFLDPLFGTNGILLEGPISAFGKESEALAIALQPDGKIIAAGDGVATVQSKLKSVFTIARFDPHGVLDSSFGTQGIAKTDVGAQASKIDSIAIQPDHKIVALGTALTQTQSGGVTGQTVLARYNSNGTLDPMFGNSGIVLAQFGQDDGPAGVSIQADGKIVAVGATFNSTPTNSERMFVGRFNANGGTDTGFGSNGQFVTDFGVAATATGVALQTDHKIVVAGVFPPSGCLIRFNTDGTIDAGFGTNGFATSLIGTNKFNLQPSAVIIQANGGILAGGDITFPTTAADFVVARYDSTGQLDTNFGNNPDTAGASTSDFGGDDFIASLALEPNGRIVAAGLAFDSMGNTSQALARYNADGSTDPTFGVGGKASTLLLGSSDASGVATQADGAIVIAGAAFDPENFDAEFLVARYSTQVTYNGCLRDSTGAFVQLNTSTGDYLFTSGCGPNGFTVAGRGTVQVQSGVVLITDTRPDRKISIGYLPNQVTGRATIVLISAPGVSRTISVNSTNPHSVCSCGS